MHEVISINSFLPAPVRGCCCRCLVARLERGGVEREFADDALSAAARRDADTPPEKEGGVLGAHAEVAEVAVEVSGRGEGVRGRGRAGEEETLTLLFPSSFSAPPPPRPLPPSSDLSETARFITAHAFSAALLIPAPLSQTDTNPAVGRSSESSATVISMRGGTSRDFEGWDEVEVCSTAIDPAVARSALSTSSATANASGCLPCAA